MIYHLFVNYFLYLFTSLLHRLDLMSHSNIRWILMALSGTIRNGLEFSTTAFIQLWKYFLLKHSPCFKWLLKSREIEIWSKFWKSEVNSFSFYVGYLWSFKETLTIRLLIFRVWAWEMFILGISILPASSLRFFKLDESGGWES